ncbi:programmed cell death protein 2 [Haematococcus lacustris]
MATTVWLGLAGDYTRDAVSADHFVTKVGGTAVFPGTTPPPGARVVTCQHCHHQLSLVLQAHCPLSTSDTPVCQQDRVLYVYGCTQPGCAKMPGSWRAFSCHLHSPNAQGPVAEQPIQVASAVGAAPRQDGCCVTSVTEAPPDLGSAVEHGNLVPNDSSQDAFGAWGSQDAQAEEDEPCLDFSALDLALDQLMQPQSEGRKQGRKVQVDKTLPSHQQQQQQQQESGITASCTHKLVPGPHTLPEFVVFAVPEPGPEGVHGEQQSRELQHIRQLLQAYEQEAAAAGEELLPALRGCGNLGESSSSSEAGSDAADTDADQPASSQEEQEGAAGGAMGWGEPQPDSALLQSEGGSGGMGAACEDVAMARRVVEASVPGLALPRQQAAAAEASQPGMNASTDQWQPEQYERDEVRGVVPSYLRFNARLQRQPDQCVRYCRGGQPLWPSRRRPAPPACPRCSSPRVFELQLMAPVIALILEAAPFMGPGDGGPDSEVAPRDGSTCSGSQGCVSKTLDASSGIPYGVSIASGSAVNAAGNWDMCTVAVYTCMQSCCGSEHANDGDGTSACWAEEFVCLVLEEDCHSNAH